MVLICCVNAISAASDNTVDNLTSEIHFGVDSISVTNDEKAINGADKNIALNAQENYDEINGQTPEDMSQNYVIYVGTNNECGNGSYENPFATLELACNGISSGKNNVTINVLDGTYYVGSDLVFNCSNLHIMGIGNVTFKNMYSEKTHDGVNSHESLDLSDDDGNFTISNVLIDTSSLSYTSNVASSYFFICKGTPNAITFNNCTFLNYGMAPINTNKNYIYKNYLFNNCEFISTYDSITSNKLTGILLNYATFKYCSFYFGKPIHDPFTAQAVSSKTTVPLFVDCWLGINSIPHNFYNSKGQFLGFNITRYAIFDVSENYLGNNTYEIIGKLVWNDSTTDGIGNFNQMVVNLNSTTGDIPATAILENGTFKVIYTSTESNHKITATLDNEVQSVEFQSVDVVLDAPSITYGDNQNITVTLPDDYNGVVYIIVNNKSYRKDVEFTKRVTVDITDVLPVGTYDVAVTFVDKIDNETCAIYGFNTTMIIVNKAIPNVNISHDGDLTPGERISIKVKIPYATENVTIIVNGDKNTTKLIDNVATYTIDELVAGTYYVTVLYAGDDSLDFAYKTDSFDVVKSTADLINELNNTVNTQENTINNQIEQISNLNDTVNNQTGIIDSQKEQISNLNDTVNAQENIINSQVEQINNLTDTVNTQAGTIDSQKEQISVLNDTVNNQSCTMDSQINEINALNDTVKAQNSTIESQKDLINNLNETIIEQNKTINNVSNPVATSILVKNIATTATTVKYFTISLIDASNNLLANKTIKFTVNGKTNTVTTNGSGIATVKVSYNTAGTRYYTFSFLGELGYSASIASAKVVVNKKATKLTAPKKTFKVKTKTKKVQVKLTTGKKALKSKKITLKVKGKTYTAKTNKKGIATFKITKLTKKGTFKYTVKFAGDKAYKATNKNGKITIK